MKGYSLVELLIVLFIIALLVSIFGGFPGRFVSKDKAMTAMEKAGYSEVQIVDRAIYFVPFRGGGKEDVVRFTCNAKNPAGKSVVGVYVYCGWPFKGTTIRFD